MLAPPITSRRNPLVARFRAAADGHASWMLLDGEHLVDEALRAGLEIDVAAVDPETVPPRLLAQLVRAIPADRLVPVTRPVLAALTPVRSPTGLVALARRPEASVAAVFRASTPLVLMAVDVQDPGNLGAMVRSAEAGGATGVMTTPSGADPYGWKALRGSMGSSLRLPIVRLADADAGLAAAKAAGCQIVAAASGSGISLYETDLRGPTVVLLGREGQGLSDALLARADHRMVIPMEGPVESLNVAVAAALIVYEARRQRDPDHRAAAITQAREDATEPRT